MAVILVIRLGPANRIVIPIKAISAHCYPVVPSWCFWDEVLIGRGDEVCSIEKESPNFSIGYTNGPCRRAFSRKATAGRRSNTPPLAQSLSRLSLVSMVVVGTGSC